MGEVLLKDCISLGCIHAFYYMLLCSAWSSGYDGTFRCCSKAILKCKDVAGFNLTVQLPAKTPLVDDGS